jgi:hypothetical protein
MEWRPPGSKKRKPNSKVQARKEWIKNTIARSEKGRSGGVGHSVSKKKGMMKGMMKPARISPVAPKKVGGQDRQRIMEAIKARRKQSY